jgi:hypothetical protein
MQTDISLNLGTWALALLLYPGVGFVLAVALLGEWVVGIVRPALSPRLYRRRPRLYGALEPLYSFVRLLGRKEAVRWQGPDEGEAQSVHPVESVLSVTGAIAPVLALCLLPLGGNPLVRDLGIVGDLFTILALLAVQPLTWVVLRAREASLGALAGGQAVGRLLTGLVPVLVLVVALLEVSGNDTLSTSGLLAAPETLQQTFVRLLAAPALLVALPWWVGKGRDGRAPEWSAGALAGWYAQTVALAALWVIMVLPTVGDPSTGSGQALAWSVILPVVGTLAAYAAIRLVSERWMPARRESEAANLVWVTMLPVAVLALVLAVWV